MADNNDLFEFDDFSAQTSTMKQMRLRKRQRPRSPHPMSRQRKAMPEDMTTMLSSILTGMSTYAAVRVCISGS